MKGKATTQESKGEKGLLPPVTRRSFLKVTGALAAVAGASVFVRGENAEAAIRTGQFEPDTVVTDTSVDVVRSMCLMCHSACGIKCKVQDGALIKIDGNPYHPNGTIFSERVPYATDPSGQVNAPNPADQGYDHHGKDIRSLASSICAKGQAGLEQLYNPFRIRQPLRRAGPRGSNQWVAISWDDALDEIAGVTPSPLGLTNLSAARDFTTDAGAFPDLGPAANKIICSVGRMEHGNKEMSDRFFSNGIKTKNKREDHTSICETSHHVAGELLGKKHMKPDLLGCNYLITFGTNPLEAGFPMVPFGRKVIQFKKTGGTLVVVDPRYSPTASKADTWLAPIPGTDAAIAWGMIRHMLDNNYYDSTYLRNANEAAAAADSGGSTDTHCDAVWLVRRDTGAYLRGNEGGLAGAATDRVCAVSGTPTPFDLAGAAQEGDLLASGINVGGIICDSVFQLLADRAGTMTVAQCAAIAGVSASDLQQIATGFWNAAPAAAATFYRGSVQHPNGTYTAMSLHYLNILVGNFDRKGGVSVGGGHQHETGSKTGQLPISENGNTNDVVGAPASAAGVKISRAGSTYFGSDEHTAFGYDLPNGHPKRPWFPQARHGNWQELEGGVDDAYPYGCSVLFIYAGNPLYSTPGLRDHGPRVYGDTSKIGLFISVDVEINETNVFADYILPDTTYLEKWSTPHLAPVILTSVSGFRQPVVGEVWDGTRYVDISSVDRPTLIGYLNAASGSGNNYAWSPTPYFRPIFTDTRTPEDLYCDLARRLGQNLGIAGGWLPAFGPNAFTTGDDVTASTALMTSWDWFRRLGVNIARGDNFPGSEVPGADDMERLAYILDRGGRFADGDGYNGNYLAKTHGKLFSIYSESLALTKRSDFDGTFDGLGKYEDPLVDWTGQPLDDGAYRFTLLTWKPAHHTQSRTAVCPSLMAIWPENFVWVNSSDAASVGVKTGDRVRLTSPTSPVAGLEVKALATEGIRPGCVAISNSYGHWQMHSVPPQIDGVPAAFDVARGAGAAPNGLMRIDPRLGNVCIEDPIGGSASFYDTKVNITKI